jgi:hypothetical protein
MIRKYSCIYAMRFNMKEEEEEEEMEERTDLHGL